MVHAPRAVGYLSLACNRLRTKTVSKDLTAGGVSNALRRGSIAQASF